LKLVIEAGGSIHNHADIKMNDEERQVALQNDGLVVLRFQNEEITRTSEKVILKIENFLSKRKNEE